MTQTDPLAPYDAVLVLSYGGPQGPEDVLPFMRNATAGRGVPDARLLEVSGHYAGFGGVSPINARNAEMLTALRAELARRGSRLPVVIGNRNWHPFVSESLRSLADAGARRVLSMTTAAYGSYSGCRQYREDTAAALAQLAAGTDGSTGQGREADAAARVGGAGGEPVSLTVDKTRPFYNTPGMLTANVDAIVAAFSELEAQGVPAAGVRLVLVTHSVPVAMEEGSSPGALGAARAGVPGLVEAPEGTSGADSSQGHCLQASGPETVPPEPGVAADLSTEISYVEQHQRLIEVLVPEVTRRLGLDHPPHHDLVYCSRSGPPQARWLEPDVNDHLEALAAGRLVDGSPTPVPAGVVVAPVGFVADHMEVVYDLDTEAKDTAARLGLPYARAATAGSHPAFITSLADLLLERAAVARGETVTPASTTGTGPFHTVCPQGCCRPAASQAAHQPSSARPGQPHHPAEPAAHPRNGGKPMTEHPNQPSGHHAAGATHPHAPAPEGTGPDAAGIHRFNDEVRRPHHDPRDATDVDFDAVNNQKHYALYTVFRLQRPLPSLEDVRRKLVGESTYFVEQSEVTTRGWYDVAGLRSDADLLIWWLDDDPEKLLDANHRLRASALGRYLEPVWSCMGLHTPAEFNAKHIPACFGGVAPRDWLMVYPFVRSYDWYLLPAEERSRIMAAHGRNGFSRYPDVKGSTLAAFGMSDYEWVLGFEADSLDRLEGVIHHQRYTEARLHVRVDTPFYTGVRVSPAEWAERQPRS